MIRGLDVSHWQGRIDWPAVAAAGARFVFLKATEGEGFVDGHYRTNVASAEAAGLLVSSYHFFSASGNGAAQAAHFLNIVGDLTGQLPPVLDIERRMAGDDGTRLSASAQAWLHAVESACGVKPIVYANVDFCRHWLKAPLAEYPLWLAHYSEEPSTDLGPWTRWLFWQHTDHGSWPGVNVGANVDLDVFVGSEEDLQALVIGKVRTTPIKIIEHGTNNVLAEYDMVTGGNHIPDQGKLYVAHRL